MLNVAVRRAVAGGITAALALGLAGCGTSSPKQEAVAPPSTTTTPPPPKNAEMQTDAAALSAAASEFDQISNELKATIAQVNATGGDLAANLTGPAGTAVQASFNRFQEAANKQIQLLDQIATTVNQAGVQYQGADDPAGSLSGDMGFDIRLPRAVQISTQTRSQDGGYNFSGIESAAAALQGATTSMQSLLDQGTACLQKLAAIWGGSGSEAYQQMQQTWDATAAELNSSMSDLSTKVTEAGAAMQDTEKGISGMFG